MEDSERIKALMAAWKDKTGLTQREFAKRFGMPGGTAVISQHMSGHRPISISQAKAYMAGFGCQLADISPAMAKKISGMPTEPGTADFTLPLVASENVKPLSPRQSRLDIAIAILRELPPELQSEAIGMIEYLASKNRLENTGT